MTGLITEKDTGIVYRKWAVPDPDFIFILVHGLGAHSGRWEFLSNFFTQHGISCYAIELKGFGHTYAKKGHVESFDVYVEDISSLKRIVSRENPGKKVFIAGESLGGLISFFTVLKKKNVADGLVCISPAFKSVLKFSAFDYLKIGLSLLFNPGREFKMPFTKEMCTRDIGYQAVLDSDKAEHRIGTAKFLYEIAKAQVYCDLHKKKFNTDLLFLMAGHDLLVANGKSREIFEAARSRNKELIEYPGMYHALSIEMGRNDVFQDIVDWTRELEIRTEADDGGI